MRRTIIVGSFCLWLGMSAPVFAFAPFTVTRIQFAGLQRISRETALNYLPLKSGQQLNNANSPIIIQSLYKTGFFEDVRLARQNSTLIVTVIEWPTIGELTITGNKAIATDKLKSALKDMGIAQGQIYNSSILARMRYSLQNEYDSLGKYNAHVTTHVITLPRNRVAVEVNISEGIPAKIAQIQIIGNEVFSENQLRRQFVLTTPSLLTIINKNDQYSDEKLQTDLQALQAFYMNHGYIKFKVISHEVSLTPDKKHIFIVIRIDEGAQYTLQNYQVSGDIPIDQKEFMLSSLLKKGEVFSRQDIINAQQVIGQILGNHGYAFAVVQIIPLIDDNQHTVSVNFSVQPGTRAYVRFINFKGNNKTEDLALRHAMLQMEGGVVNLRNINDSLRNLNMLGFVTGVTKELVPVPGTNNQVDMNVNVTESQSAQVQVGAGYSTLDKFFVTAGLTQKNFLGTGRALGVNFSNSAFVRSYSITYSNPYYTLDGVSQSVSFYIQRYNPGNIGLSSTYVYNTYGANVNYGIPLGIYDRISGGIGLQRVDLILLGDPALQLPFINNFVQLYGARFKNVMLSTGYSHNTYDRAVFPTEGLNHSLGATLALPLGGSNGLPGLRYYQLNYNFEGFQPLTPSRNFILVGQAGVAYGNGFGSTNGLPFFANYYGGGIDSNIPLAGLESSTLGPKVRTPCFTDAAGNTGSCNLIPVGGNFGMYGVGGIILPPVTSSLRSMLFVAGAKLYNTNNLYFSSVQQNIPGDLDAYNSALKPRFSAGIEVEWQTPIIGTLVFALAKPFKTYAGDEPSPFAFTFGASF